MKPLLSDVAHRSMKNLGTFSTSYLEKDSREVFDAYASLNGIDTHAYPELESFLESCKAFMLDLSQTTTLKTDFRVLSTTASSEAIFLAVYFLKQRWQSLTPLNHSQPNIILSTNTHISWLKAAKYLNVGVKIIPIQTEDLSMDSEALEPMLDHNTIAVCATLGSPTTLCFDSVDQINRLLATFYQTKHVFIPIHVDAASGGFIAPFIYPQLSWGFTLSHVYSLNISSHKYGLVYPSLGWLVTRKIICPESHAFQQNYLGKPMQHFEMRFSHSAANLAVQAHHIDSKQFSGYQHIIGKLQRLATELKHQLAALPEITILSPEMTPQLPGVVFMLKNNSLNLQELIQALRQKGWIVPIYSLPLATHVLSVARIVVRYGMTEDTIQSFLNDFKKSLSTITTNR